jgi:DNA recombination protein RmuC
MVQHCDFIEQESRDTDGGRLRPDMIVRLPGGKNVIIDAKAPLQAYLDALEARDDDTRSAQLHDHARQVRDHMTNLSSKGYWSQFEPAPEFVVMFLPGETFFSTALQFDPSLIEFGVERGVIPASPTTLIALLRAVAYGWRQEALAENAQAISDLGRTLYERICKWAEHLGRVGKGIEHAAQAYDDAVGSLERRVLVSARKFPELGVSSGGEIPDLPSLGRPLRKVMAEECGGDGDEPVDPESVEEPKDQLTGSA